MIISHHDAAVFLKKKYGDTSPYSDVHTKLAQSIIDQKSDLSFSKLTEEEQATLLFVNSWFFGKLEKFDEINHAPNLTLKTTIYIAKELESNRHDSTIESYLKKALEWNFGGEYGSGRFGAEDLAVLDKIALAFGLPVEKFKHNCKEMQPTSENKALYRAIFAGVVKNAGSIKDLFVLNTRDFRDVPGLEKCYRTEGGIVLWLGKSHKQYRRLFFKKLEELSKIQGFQALFEAVTVDAWAGRRCLRQSGWLFNEKFMRESILLLIRSATVFAHCKAIRNSMKVGGLYRHLLERFSELARTPADHFLVARLAQDCKVSRKKMWKKHVLLCAERLQKRKKR